MEKTVRQVRFTAPASLRQKRVAAYARVSSGKDEMLHSLSAQVSYYNGMIQKHPEWEYAGVYADEAITGTKEGRENFQRMLADCRAGKIDIVITKSISRFARNTVTLLRTIRELKELGVAVIFEEQKINTMTAEGELLLTLLASFAQAESQSVSENMKWRYRRGFENGEVMCVRHLYGYDVSRNGISINEEEAEVIRDIYRRFLEGESMESIARHLNDIGVRGIFGGRVTGTSVRRWLEQEKYAGNSLMQKYYVGDYLEKKTCINHGELPMYYAEATHDAIIDKDTYDKAQDRLKEITERNHMKKPKHSIFSGKIRCAKCGCNFIKAQNRKLVWKCLRTKRTGDDKCRAKQIPDDTLRKVCCEVLGINEFDDAVFNARIDSITADTDEENNILTFCLSNGEVIVKRWKSPSRSKSWTPEMKEAARQAAMKGGDDRGSK